MPKISLITLIGACLLGATGFAIHSWLEIDRAMLPMSETFVISNHQRMMRSFESNHRMAQESYLVNLSIENARQQKLDCNNINALDLQWSISTSSKLPPQDRFIPISSDEHYPCTSQDPLGFTFKAPKFQGNAKHFFHLQINGKTPKIRELKIFARIHTHDGINTHYAFMDKAMVELFSPVIFIVSILCFIPDLLRLYWYYQESNKR